MTARLSSWSAHTGTTPGAACKCQCTMSLAWHFWEFIIQGSMASLRRAPAAHPGRTRARRRRARRRRSRPGAPPGGAARAAPPTQTPPRRPAPARPSRRRRRARPAGSARARARTCARAARAAGMSPGRVKPLHVSSAPARHPATPGCSGARRQGEGPYVCLLERPWWSSRPSRGARLMSMR